MYRQKLSVSTQLYMKLVVAFVDWKGQSVDSYQRFCLAAKIIDTEAGGVDEHEC